MEREILSERNLHPKFTVVQDHAWHVDELESFTIRANNGGHRLSTTI